MGIGDKGFKFEVGDIDDEGEDSSLLSEGNDDDDDAADDPGRDMDRLCLLSPPLPLPLPPLLPLLV